MAHSTLDIPLPELTTENFKRAWAQFELVAKAKEWEEPKQLTILPTLLRGKMLDYFINLGDDEKRTLKTLKKALVKAAGLAEDPLVSAKAFVARNQGDNEKVLEFASALKKLFQQAYPTEPTTSTVLLQRFVTGLRGPISKQLLLRKRPDNLAQAIEDAVEIEYAINFDTTADHQQRAINIVREENTGAKLQQETLSTALEEMTKRMTALEIALHKNSAESSARRDTTDAESRGRYQDRGRRLTCYLCGEEGHIRRNCPLNFTGPVRRADGWPRRRQ